MEFKRNELINEVLVKYYETFSLTLDTKDYVPDKFNKKILNYIYKNMKKSLKQTEKEYRKYIKEIKLEECKKMNEQNKYCWLYKIFHRKKNVDNKSNVNSSSSEAKNKNLNL